MPPELTSVVPLIPRQSQWPASIPRFDEWPGQACRLAEQAILGLLLLQMDISIPEKLHRHAQEVPHWTHRLFHMGI